MPLLVQNFGTVSKRQREGMQKIVAVSQCNSFLQNRDNYFLLLQFSEAVSNEEFLYR